MSIGATEIAGPTVIDLFAGCGGISAGFREAGFSVLAAVELNPRPLAVFGLNFPAAVAVNADVRALDPRQLMDRVGLAPGQLDVLVGGPPCQGWSKNVPARHRSLADPRNALVFRFLDYLAALRPRYALIENVAEMERAYDRAATDLVHARLADLGYSTRQDKVLASDWGVPQLRRRTLIVAGRDGRPPPVPDRRRGAPVAAWEAISDLPPLAAGGSAASYATAPGNEFQRWARSHGAPLTDHDARPLTPRQMDRVRALPPGSGAGASDLPPALRPRKAYSGAYARLYPDQPARTITRWVFHPGSGRFLHPYDDRTVTIREAARLQGFPDRFRFAGSFIERSHMIGEAVPPLLATAYAEAMRATLRQPVG
jgi:DNA (cytosine-5)-methyltransferase 1